MPTFHSSISFILTLLFLVQGTPGKTQTADGSLFFLDDLPGSKGIYRLSYPSLQLQQLDTVLTSDIALDSQNLFVARGNYWDSTGIDKYDLNTLLKIDSLRGFRALRLSVWDDYLLLVSGDPPYVRILDPNAQWQTLFTLDSNKVPFPPGAVQTDGSRAYLMEGQAILVVDLLLQDTLLRIPTPHPYTNQDQNAYLSQSENDLWIGVQYATGAVRSSLLRMSKDSLKVSTAFHNEGNDFWGPPVPLGEQIHVYGYPSYYDLSDDSLHYGQGNYPYAIAGDSMSNTLFVWNPGIDSLYAYTQGTLINEFYYPGHIREAQFLPQSSTQGLGKSAFSGFDLFPNPAKGEVWLRWEQAKPGWTYRWLDVNGRVLADGKLPVKGRLSLKVPNLTGLLILSLSGPHHERVGFRVWNQP